MSEDQFKVILDRIDNMQQTVDRIDRDLNSDRRDLQEFTIRLGAVENQVEEMRKFMHTQADKVKDKVEDVMQPVEKEIQDLKQELESKKVFVVRDKVKSIFFWRR